jgi:membrane protease subunit HflK
MLGRIFRNDDSPWGKKPSNQDDEFEDLIRGSQKKLKDLFGKKGSGGGYKGPMPPKFNASVFTTIAIVAVLLWLSSGFYTVNEGEKAAVLRFGRYVTTKNAGLNYHLPYPFESVIKKRVDQIEREEVGFRSTGEYTSEFNKKVPSKNVPEESLMLTGDENIVDINFVIQWRIKNIEQYLFNIHRQAESVKASAESALREVIANSPIAAALAEGKLDIENKSKILMQNILDFYGSGVEIVNVQMLRADPPAEVIDAFRDVQTARADKEREINQSETYRNDIIPRARGEAEKIIQAAEAYKQEVVAKADGDASRFISVYEQYKNAKDVTRKRIYLETMEDILEDLDKIIIDNKSNVLPYLPLKELKKDIKG